MKYKNINFELKELIFNNYEPFSKSLFNGLLLSSIIGVGSYLQITIISLLEDINFSTSREYSSLFPNLSDFFNAAYTFENLIVSFFIFILYFKIKNKNLKIIFLYLSMTIYVTALDIVYSIYIHKSFNTYILFEHLICNFVGFFLVCSILITINHFLSKISEAVSHKKISYVIIFNLLLAVSSFLYILTGYYIIKFIGENSSINLSLQASNRFSIYSNIQPNQKTKSKLSFEQVEFSSPKIIDFIKIDYPIETDIDILFTAYCSNKEIEKFKTTKFIKNTSNFILEKVPARSTVNFTNNKADTNVELNLGDILLLEKTNTKDINDSIISITSDKTNFSLESFPSKEKLTLHVPLVKVIESNKKNVENENKIIHLKSGSKEFYINLINTRKDFKTNEKFKCKKISPQINENKYIFSTDDIFPQITFIFNTKEFRTFENFLNKINFEFSSNEETKFTFFQNEPNYSMINGIKVKSLSLNGDLDIITEGNGNLIKVKSRTLESSGEFKFDISNEKHLNIFGNSKYLHIDDLNINKTRWEELGSTEKISIFTIIFGVIFFIMKNSWAIIKSGQH